MTSRINRKNLQSVSPEIETLLEYADAFLEYDTAWSRLANREDFDKVYTLDDNFKNSWEDIYATGRDLAGGMVELLQRIHDVGEHPTLSSYIKSFSETWVEEIEHLEAKANEAESLLEISSVRPWSVREMISLFKKQIGLLKAVKMILNSLETSNLYKKENGLPMTEDSKSHINIGNFQGILGNVDSSTITQDFSTIKQGDTKALLDYFKSINIPAEDLKILATTIHEEKPNEDKTVGPKLSEWIGKMISKSASGSWKVSLAIASEIIAKAIAAYYGW